MRRRVIGWALVLACLWMGFSAYAISVGVGIGFDPTGVTLVNAITETPITEFLDARAEVGIALNQIAGLMLISIDVLGHMPFPPVDPFAGIGIGAALTPPPFSTGLILEAVGGVRIIPAEPLILFAQARLIARYSAAVWTIGPVYEAGVQLRF